ncbi:MAG: UDP-N-acetylglucosamine pyrophosphorylase [Clostridiales bacterium]|nr:UDP-N-acetylglucosamine pyrophosphorylase [Clostridiales bacterium]
MNKQLKNKDLFSVYPFYLKNLFEAKIYPWEVLPHIKEYILSLIDEGMREYTLLKKDVLIGPRVKIYPTAVIEGPTIIGGGTVIRPGAFIRGSVITGKNCVIGNSTELKNCILMDGVQVPHYNYVGDSILGSYSHMGAGSICSNLKSDGKNVVIHGDANYETGLRKVGAILGEKADIGCGCVLNPGTVIGKGTQVYPLTPLRGVYPHGCIVKANNNIVMKENKKD